MDRWLGGGRCAGGCAVSPQERLILANAVDTVTAPGHAYVTTLQGLLTGFLFPLAPLFLFKEAEQHRSFLAPGTGGDTGGVVFSKRMQMAILLGLAVNVSFGALRMLA